MPRRGYKATPEHRAAVSAALRRRVRKPVSPETREKIRATLTGRVGVNKGKKYGPHAPEHAAKISAAMTGVKKTPEHAAKIAAARTGTKRSPDTIEKMRAAMLGNVPSAETRAKISAANSGRNNPHFGKPTLHGPRTHWQRYGDIALRSSYEVRLAKVFDRLGKPWVYEPQRFDLGSCTYLPDFYLPNERVYWEVKGWFDPVSQKKIALFRELHPELPVIVATEPIIKSMEGVRI